MKTYIHLKKIHLIAGLFILSSHLTLAQTTISGKVVDEKNHPLPGANVYIKGSIDGASTSENGSFSFSTDETGEKILAVSFVSFENFEQKVELTGNPIELNIKLKEQASELNTVVISAGAIEASDTKRSVALKPLDIITTAGSVGDFQGAIKTLPGAQASVGETEGIFVRGGSATETKTIIDEMVVQNPFFSSVPDVAQRSRFSPFLFKGTVFSTGGYSAQYGQALSSVLAFNTLDFPEQTTTGIGIGPMFLNLSHSHKWDNTSLAIEGNYTNLRPYYSLIKQNVMWDRPPEALGGSLIFRQRLSESGILKVYTTYNQNNLSMYYPGTTPILTRFELTNKNIYTNTSYRDKLGKNWTYFIGASLSHDDNHIYIDTANMRKSEQLGQFKFFVTRSLFKSSSLLFGTEFHNYNYQEGFNEKLRSLRDNYTAIFVETDIFITRKIAGRIGVRGEYSSILQKMNLAPRTSLAFKTGDKSQISLAYGMFYQNPDNKYIFLDRSIEFERTQHYIANYQVMDDYRTFRIEGYYKTYDHMIRDSSITHSAELTNEGYGYARGFDIFYRDKKTIKNGDFWISYSFVDTKRLYQNFPVLATPSFASTHTFSIVYKHYIAKLRTSFNATNTFATGRTYFNPTNPVFMDDRTPYYNNLSLSASYLTNIKGNFTVIFFSVTNVLGRENIFSYRYSNDGTSRSTVGQPATRSYIVGLFISIGQAFKP